MIGTVYSIVLGAKLVWMPQVHGGFILADRQCDGFPVWVRHPSPAVPVHCVRVSQTLLGGKPILGCRCNDPGAAGGVPDVRYMRYCVARPGREAGGRIRLGGLQSSGLGGTTARWPEAAATRITFQTAAAVVSSLI